MRLFTAPALRSGEGVHIAVAALVSFIMIAVTTVSFLFSKVHNENWSALLLTVSWFLMLATAVLNITSLRALAYKLNRTAAMRALIFMFVCEVAVFFAFTLSVFSVFSIGIHTQLAAPYPEMIAYASVRFFLLLCEVVLLLIC